MENREYDHIFENAKRQYRALGRVYCKALECRVAFNSIGFRHLLYKHPNGRRNQRDIIRRLKLVALAAAVVNKAQQIKAYRSQTDAFGRSIECWKLEKAIRGSKKTTVVILKRIGAGKIVFYSVWDK